MCHITDEYLSSVHATKERWSALKIKTAWKKVTKNKSCKILEITGKYFFSSVCKLPMDYGITFRIKNVD
jgi:hypothetical protein